MMVFLIAEYFCVILHILLDFCVLLCIILLEYRKETDTKAVRKNVSMPAWMSYMADKRGVNCSQLLQDALMKELQLA